MSKKEKIDIEDIIETKDEDGSVVESDNKKYMKSQPKTKKCKVLFYDLNKNILHLDFDGFGIQIEDKTGLNKKEVEIFYTSEIGKSDFKFELVK